MTSKYRIAVLDAGGQYVDLVKKALERHGVEAEVLPLATPLGDIEEAYQAIVISGSPASSHAEDAIMPDPALWQTKLPLLGICYGMQAMVMALGGKVKKNSVREDGRITTMVDTTEPIFKDLKPDFSALFTHGDFVNVVPAGFKVIGSHLQSDGDTAYSAIRRDNLIGVQFHPEVFDDTPGGYQLFSNFLSWANIVPDSDHAKRQSEALIAKKIKEITNQVGSKNVIAFVSGGVDSAVAISLTARAISKDQLHAYFIDNGFMRQVDEQVIETLGSAGISVNKINASKEFEEAFVMTDEQKYGPLSEITDPEIKRKIIGKAFIDVQTRIMREKGLDNPILMQGTNAADRIESGHSVGDKNTQTIKTHHNQVKEVYDLKAEGRLLEPLDDLFKDEIRRLGLALGLPKELVMRQPFPGPGLAIRIIASKNSEANLKPDYLDALLNNELKKSNFDVQANLLPIKSVGVGGDERSHLNVVAISGGFLSPDQLRELSSKLTGHFPKYLNRVIYRPGPIALDKLHLTKTLLTEDVRTQLRSADQIVYEEMQEFNLLDKISQCPVILLPISVNSPGERSIVLRPVKTSTFMTVQAMLPGEEIPVEFFKVVAQRIFSETNGISAVFLDITNKPPATTEWE